MREGIKTQFTELYGSLHGMKLTDKPPTLIKLAGLVAELKKLGKEFIARVFSPAKTVAAFKAEAEKLITDKFDAVKGLKLDTLNRSASAILEVVDRFDMPKMMFFGSVNKMGVRARQGRARASYRTLTRAFSGELITEGVTLNTKLNDDDAEQDFVTMKEYYSGKLESHKERILNNPRVSQDVKDLLPKLTSWQWSDNNNVQAIMWHESGHRLHRHPKFKDDELDRLVRAAYQDGWAFLVGEYAVTNHKEYFAETFVLYMKGKHDLINPKILAYLKKADKANNYE